MNSDTHQLRSAIYLEDILSINSIPDMDQLKALVIRFYRFAKVFSIPDIVICSTPTDMVSQAVDRGDLRDREVIIKEILTGEDFLFIPVFKPYIESSRFNNKDREDYTVVEKFFKTIAMCLCYEQAIFICPRPSTKV